MSKTLAEWNDYSIGRIGINWLGNPLHFERLMHLKKFLDDSVNHTVLDCGCGEKEPAIVCNRGNAVALDLSIVALKNLRSIGFKGHLILGHCLFLPFRERCFEKSVSSELIEHLNSKREVSAFKREIERVSNSIMLTTPNSEFLFMWSDPTHKLFFNSKNIKEIFNDYALSQASLPSDVLTHFIKLYAWNKFTKWLRPKIGGARISQISGFLARITHGGAFIILKKNFRRNIDR